MDKLMRAVNSAEDRMANALVPAGIRLSGRARRGSTAKAHFARAMVDVPCIKGGGDNCERRPSRRATRAATEVRSDCEKAR
jgi:hypothetical protein